MPKKRNCKRTSEERTIHEKAVALRKMSDQQLVDYVNNQYTSGLDAGKHEVKPQPAWESPQHITEQILLALSLNVKGIGPTLIAKMKPVIQKNYG